MTERIIRYEQVLDNKKGELLIWPVTKFPIVFRRRQTNEDPYSLYPQVRVSSAEWDALHDVTDWCEANLPLIAERRSWAMNRTHVGVKTSEIAMLFKLRWV
ncbi:MAG: hypothetical protein EOP83_07910 [Verrucomicrobiaceae bacterium]|nr:MAG: hypothetical protein EOP83_07910 [Verrucomicrobiaceae bacterium]